MLRDARMFDAVAALGFLVSQLTVIEPEVYRVRYPDIQYPQLIPVDTTANQWAKTITFFSIDMVGQADWFAGAAKDIPEADVMRNAFQSTISMAAIGYRWTIEELGVMRMIPGTNLPNDRAMAAKRAAEEFVDNVALQGDATKGYTGLYANPLVAAGTAPATGTGNVPYWAAKTPDQILLDFNAVLTGVYVQSLSIEMADTVLLPLAVLNYIASTPRSPNVDTTILKYLQENNVYTQQTGQQLTIRSVRGLEQAGAGATGRMIAYRRDPTVLKLHMPMPHNFLPPWQNGPLVFLVPGIMRLGGLEIRRPGAIRYLDGIAATSALTG